MRTVLQRILWFLYHDKRKITADTDLRLCKYFGMSKGFFLRLQMDLDLLEAEDTKGLQADLENIICITTQSTTD